MYGHVILKACNLLPWAAITRAIVSMYSEEMHSLGCLTTPALPVNYTSLYSAQLALRQNLMSSFLVWDAVMLTYPYTMVSLTSIQQAYQDR